MLSYRHFWSSNSLLQVDFVANAMSRVRFDWIFSNLHLNDYHKPPNRNDINFDKLYKLRPLDMYRNLKFTLARKKFNQKLV